MRRASVECKDSSGLVGFDYYELHFFTPLGPNITITPAIADKSEGVFKTLLMPAERYPASPYFRPPHLPYFQPSGPKHRFFQKPNFLHFWASGPLGNCRGRDLELNGLIGIEICFFGDLEIWRQDTNYKPIDTKRINGMLPKIYGFGIDFLLV